MDSETTKEIRDAVLNFLDNTHTIYPDIVTEWIESLDYIHKDEAYDYVCENAEGRCDR
jgi:hypothetical protein